MGDQDNAGVYHNATWLFAAQERTRTGMRKQHTSDAETGNDAMEEYDLECGDDANDENRDQKDTIDHHDQSRNGVIRENAVLISYFGILKKKPSSPRQTIDRQHKPKPRNPKLKKAENAIRVHHALPPKAHDDRLSLFTMGGTSASRDERPHTVEMGAGSPSSSKAEGNALVGGVGVLSMLPDGVVV